MIGNINIEHNQLLLIIYSTFLVLSIIFSYLLNKVLLKFSTNMGISNHDVSISRWSNITKPAFGGISFFIVFLISVTTYNIFFDLESTIFNKELLGIIAATSVAFMMGIADDAYNTNPGLKFGTQFFCGIILIYTGTYISLFPWEIANYILTMFWIVGMMNSINMLDNMDGITATVSIFSILAAMLTIFLYNDYSSVHVLVLIGVLGALIGFLFFNWHPSRMFMGDGGSQFLGVFLGAIGIIYFWNNQGLTGDEAPTKQIVIVMLAFIMPLIDTTTVTINRLKKGIPPWVGGRDHTTHHLSYLGYSDSKVGFIFGGLSLVSVLLIYIIIDLIEDWTYAYTALFVGYFLIVFGVLYRNTLITKAPEKPKKKKQ